jgi:hypothetical protein
MSASKTRCIRYDLTSVLQCLLRDNWHPQIPIDSQTFERQSKLLQRKGALGRRLRQIRGFAQSLYKSSYGERQKLNPQRAGHLLLSTRLPKYAPPYIPSLLSAFTKGIPFPFLSSFLAPRAPFTSHAPNGSSPSPTASRPNSASCLTPRFEESPFSSSPTLPSTSSPPSPCAHTHSYPPPRCFPTRHALDADHVSAIDLMTRRLVAT